MAPQIVHTVYRRKRPARKRKAVALEVPAIVRAKRVAKDMPADDATKSKSPAGLTTPAANRNSVVPENADRQSAIVTARRPKAVVNLPPGLLPDTPEEHKRRGDAADALFRELVRRAASKEP
jgi:hypothetical protein